MGWRRWWVSVSECVWVWMSVSVFGVGSVFEIVLVGVWAGLFVVWTGQGAMCSTLACSCHMVLRGMGVGVMGRTW